MEVEITNLTKEKINDNIIIKVVDEVSKKLKVKDKFVSIVLVNNEKIYEINKTYRNKDSITDVISFAFLDDKISESDYLGEIYISLEKAHSQSEEYGHSFERELSFLVVHGLLHLLGYDHIKESDEEIMFKLQEEILRSIGVNR